MAYDAKAVKIGKEVKRIAATIMDKNLRRSFIRGFVECEEAAMRVKTTRKSGNKETTRG